MEGGQIISGDVCWEQWLQSPPGRYLLEWEQAQFDLVVADLFCYVALQCGLPQLESLRANRMSSKLLACIDDCGLGAGSRVRLAGFDELPFDSQSIDLIVLPHVLEYTNDPHRTLREVERVLRPEGRLIMTGFNPVSLWGARQLVSFGPMRAFLPQGEGLIGYPRLRDWLKLLGFELERARYGCFRPPYRSQRWLDRTGFMERAGDRWWPICGAVYLVSAVKRVQSMRLVGKLWRTRTKGARLGAPAAQRASSQISQQVKADPLE